MESIPDYDDEQDEIIDESPEYSPKSEFSKAKQVDAAVIRVIESRAKEMKAGYWNIQIQNGFPIKQWIPDTRKSFISSVNALSSLMSPETMRDEKFRKKQEEIKKKISDLYSLYSYEEKKIEYRNDGRTVGGIPVWISTGIKYIPEIGAVVTIPNPSQQNFANNVLGGWDDKTNAYWDSLVDLYDEIFAELNHVIDRLNYFKQKVLYG